MSKSNDRMVYKRGNEWVNKANENDRISSARSTQKEAYDSAKSMLQKSGGGEITIKGKNGLIREKNTIKPGNDPKNIKGWVLSSSIDLDSNQGLFATKNLIQIIDLKQIIDFFNKKNYA